MAENHDTKETPETPATVTVIALRYHTLNGEEHPEGSTYEVGPAHVESLIAQGMAKRSE